MHCFFGAVNHTLQHSPVKTACGWFERTYESAVQRLACPLPELDLAVSSARGSIIGVASNEIASLVYLGNIHRPFPGLTNQSPLDNPDGTAEQLLIRYLNSGQRFLDGIFGQYAVVVADSRERIVLLGAGPSSGCRLFVQQSGNELVFATTLALFRGLSNTDLLLEQYDEDFLLSYEFLPDHLTAYRNVQWLKPLSLLTWTVRGITTREIPPPQSQRSTNVAMNGISEGDAIEALYESFMHSLEAVTPSASVVPVLLGGFDSALVAAGLRALGKRVETYTFQFEDPTYNQANIAALRDYLGSSHTNVPITPERLGTKIPCYGRYFNQPSSHAHYPIQTLIALELIRINRHRHCLTGDGCDEIFLGYPTIYRRARLFAALGILPRPIVRAGRFLLGVPFVEDYFGHVARTGRSALLTWGRGNPSRSCVAHRVFDEFSLARFNFSTSTFEGQFEATLTEIAVKSGLRDPFYLAFFAKSLLGTTRNRNEGATASSGLSIQSPYQHPLMVNLCRSLPKTLLRPTSSTRGHFALGKYLLLRMAETKRLLPHSIIYQPKASPVTAPVDYWYHHTLRESVRQSISKYPRPYNEAYVDMLLRPRISEELFRRHVGIGRYTSHLVSMIVTYAELVGSD